jgi:hypothetical protein
MTAPVVRHPGELRWETRLLVVVTAALTAFGITSLYAAASMQENAFGLALGQLVGAIVGGVLILIVSRIDYHVWRPLAWPNIFRQRFSQRREFGPNRGGDIRRLGRLDIVTAHGDGGNAIAPFDERVFRLNFDSPDLA